jgi:hypothetical protein
VWSFQSVARMGEGVKDYWWIVKRGGGGGERRAWVAQASVC